MSWTYGQPRPYPTPNASNIQQAMYLADYWFTASQFPTASNQYYVNGPGGYWTFVRYNWRYHIGEWQTYSYPPTSAAYQVPPPSGGGASGGSGGATPPSGGYTGATPPPAPPPPPPAVPISVPPVDIPPPVAPGYEAAPSLGTSADRPVAAVSPRPSYSGDEPEYPSLAAGTRISAHTSLSGLNDASREGAYVVAQPPREMPVEEPPTYYGPPAINQSPYGVPTQPAEDHGTYVPGVTFIDPISGSPRRGLSQAGVTSREAFPVFLKAESPLAPIQAAQPKCKCDATIQIQLGQLTSPPLNAFGQLAYEAVDKRIRSVKRHNGDCIIAAAGDIGNPTDPKFVDLPAKGMRLSQVIGTTTLISDPAFADPDSRQSLDNGGWLLYRRNNGVLTWFGFQVPVKVIMSFFKCLPISNELATFEQAKNRQAPRLGEVAYYAQWEKNRPTGSFNYDKTDTGYDPLTAGAEDDGRVTGDPPVRRMIFCDSPGWSMRSGSDIRTEIKNLVGDLRVSRHREWLISASNEVMMLARIDRSEIRILRPKYFKSNLFLKCTIDGNVYHSAVTSYWAFRPELRIESTEYELQKEQGGPEVWFDSSGKRHQGRKVYRPIYIQAGPMSHVFWGSKYRLSVRATLRHMSHSSTEWTPDSGRPGLGEPSEPTNWPLPDSLDFLES